MKHIKAFVGLFVVVAAFYLAFKLMPPYYNQLQFQDAVDQEARSQSYAIGKSEEDIRKIVLKDAQDNNIPITADQIQITRGVGEVVINVDYVVHVDIPLYPIDLKFHAGSKNKAM